MTSAFGFFDDGPTKETKVKIAKDPPTIMDFTVVQPKIKMTPFTEIPKSILKNKRKRGPGVNSLLHS